MVTRVYLVRHGEAQGNIDGTFQGHTDCEITEKGKLQLACLKERFKEISFDAIFSSPLLRTIETAEAVNFYHDLSLQVDRGLIEINGGVFEGKFWKEIEQIYPNEHEIWTKTPHKFKITDGENMEDCYNRITLTVTKLAARNRGKTIVIVSHGCAIRNFLCYAMGGSADKLATVPWSDNTAVSEIEFDHNLKPTIIFQNDVTHLTSELLTLKHQDWWDESVAAKA